MVKKVLLVNPVPSDFPPLALMKFSTYYKKLGYETKYIEKINMFEDFIPDLILVTSLFTWHYDEIIRTVLFLRHQNPSAEIFVGGICASLMQKDMEKEFKGKNIQIHFGIHKSYDDEELDYSLSKKDYSIGYTTRGCLRKCGWCMVWRLEPEYKELKKEQWTKFIKHKRVLFYDNNILKASMPHFKEVIEYLKFNDISYDFNQAMDCRLLTEEHLKIMQGSKLQPMRLAFDSMDADGDIQKAMDLSIKYGFTDGNILMLYNFNDTPEEFYYRLKEVIKKWYFDAYPMKYQLLKSKKKDVFVGKHWKGTRLINFKVTLNQFFNNSILGRGLPVEKFERIFGKNYKEFTEMLDHKDIKKRNEELTLKDKKKNTFKDQLFEFSDKDINKIIDDSEGLLTRKDAIEILKRNG